MLARLSIAFVLLAVLVTALTRAADEPADKKSDQSAKAAAKAPSTGAEKSDEAPLKPDDEYYELFRSFADTLDQVERNYVQKVDRRELMEAAIKGVLSKLDPYSSYIGPEEFGGFKTSVESQFGGIGIQITMDEGQLKVLSPLVGTPAYRAGVQAGDRIVKIEGEPTKGIDIDAAIRRLKGEAGTSVTFTVIHALDNREETVTLKREVIQIDTVMGDGRKPNDEWDFMLDPDRRIGYIRLTAFSRDTAADLKKALEELVDRKMRGLVLDLRFNPGGLLTSAIDVSDLFVHKGTIVGTKGRSIAERTWEAKDEGTFKDFPMVVLVNRYSASASEIVAACLQDHNRAIIIGERTWGKGSVQNVIELEAGKSALKLTTASYQRPNGHNIHRFPDAKETDEWGVKPNDGYELKLPERELGRLVMHRRQRDILAAKPRTEIASTEKKPVDQPKTDADKPADDSAKSEKTSDAPKEEPGDKKNEEKPAADEKPESPPAESDKPGDDGDKQKQQSSDNADDGKSGVRRPPEFVDRQLQKAIEYLTSELAKAN
jgi:carboxyl-terminal processing protease